MNSSLAASVLIAMALVLANWPFMTERLLLVGPRRVPKALGWRLLELLMLAAVIFGLGTLTESRIGQRHPQGWEFHAVGLCLFLTFAFPGFAWRYLRRNGLPNE